MRRRWWIRGIGAAVLAIWLIGGLLRAESAGRAWFSQVHANETVTNVVAEGVTPALPPFWQVNISGDVTEAGRTEPSYLSVMVLWVEPITGFAIVMAAG